MQIFVLYRQSLRLPKVASRNPLLRHQRRLDLAARRRVDVELLRDEVSAGEVGLRARHERVDQRLLVDADAGDRRVERDDDVDAKLLGVGAGRLARALEVRQIAAEAVPDEREVRVRVLLAVVASSSARAARGSRRARGRCPGSRSRAGASCRRRRRVPPL